MGAVGGGIWHMLKGTKNSPSGARLRGGVEVSPVSPAQQAPQLRGGCSDLTLPAGCQAFCTCAGWQLCCLGWSLLQLRVQPSGNTPQGTVCTPMKLSTGIVQDNP